MEQMTCSMCDRTYQGVAYDWDTYAGMGGALVYQCQNCNAGYCWQCQDKHLKAIKIAFKKKLGREPRLQAKLLDGSCPQCGESFEPNPVLILKAVSLMHEQSLEPTQISQDVIREITKKIDKSGKDYEQHGTFEGSASRQQALDLLRIHGTAFVHSNLKLGPAYLVALARIGADWLFEDGKIEDFLISLDTGGYMKDGRPARLPDQEKILRDHSRLSRRLSKVDSLVTIAANTKSSKAIPLIIDELKDTESPDFVRTLACMYPDPELVGALIETLGSTYRPTRVATGLADSVREYLSVQEAAIMTLIDIGDERGIVAVIPLLLRKKEFAEWTEHSKKTVDMLSQIGDKAIAPLVKALSSGNTDVRDRATKALGVIGDVSAVAPLIKVLSSENTVVQDHAAKALGVIGDVRAVDPLIATLEAGNTSGSVINALGQLGDIRAVDPLIATLVETGDTAGAYALGQLGDARAVGPLLNVWKNLKGPIGWLDRKSIGSSIEKIASEHSQDISIAESLVLALKDEDAKLRMFAAKCLGIAGGERAVAALTEALKDQDRKVQKAAQKALKTIKKKSK